MTKKHEKKKLKLKRETVRALVPADLSQVVGGVSGSPSDACPSDACTASAACNFSSPCQQTIKYGGNHNQSFRRRGR